MISTGSRRHVSYSLAVFGDNELPVTIDQNCYAQALTNATDQARAANFHRTLRIPVTSYWNITSHLPANVFSSISSNRLARDIKVGAMGELYVSNCIQKFWFVRILISPLKQLGLRASFATRPARVWPTELEKQDPQRSQCAPGLP